MHCGRELRNFHGRNVCGRFRHSGFGRQLFQNDFPHLGIIFIHPPLLIHGRTVIITRQVRLVFSRPSVVGSGRESEIGASVENEQAEGTPLVHKPADVVDHSRGGSPIPLPPVPQPARIRFRGKNGNSRIAFISHCPMAVVQPRIQPYGHAWKHHAFQKMFSRAVGGVKGAKTLPAPERLQPFHILAVFTLVAPVFVFKLGHQNGAPVFG